jgi:hypothetical protein
MITNVFLDQKRVNASEHMVKMVPRENYHVSIYIYSLLIKKDICDRQKFLCVCVCLSSRDLFNFLTLPFLCVIHTSVLSFPRGLLLYNYIHINHFLLWCDIPLRARAYQLTADLISVSTYQKTEVIHHPLSEVSMTIPNSCWLSRPELLLQIRSYTNSSWCRVSTVPYNRKKILPPWDGTYTVQAQHNMPYSLTVRKQSVLAAYRDCLEYLNSACSFLIKCHLSYTIKN